jgi:hypothetical protein
MILCLATFVSLLCEIQIGQQSSAFKHFCVEVVKALRLRE